MKCMIAVTSSIDEYLSYGPVGFLLPLKNYSVSYEKVFSLEEIKKIREDYPELEIFVVINKTIFNHDLEQLTSILEELDQISIQGVFFYDLSILEIKKKKHLTFPLVWNQTHMVTNSKTCNFYVEQGVKYGLIAGELEKSEILSLVENTSMKLFYTLVSMPIVAHSKRSLITNYQKISKQDVEDSFVIHEKVQNQDYLVTESSEGTSFFYRGIPNHYSILEELDVPYVILNESYIDHDLFLILLKLTNQYLCHELTFSQLLSKVNPLLDGVSPFLNHKTIYRVKKGENHEKN